jgi:starvation-inducible DNA-binding protein
MEFNRPASLPKGAKMPINSALSDLDRMVTRNVLRSAVVDLVDLSLVAKQAHWNLIGPRFHSIHLQLDEIVEVARRYTDAIAERASAIGVPADGCADTVAKDSALPAIAKGWLKEDDVVAYFVTALTMLINKMRAGIAETQDVDPVSQDLLIAATAELEKERWMMWATQQTDLFPAS